jgi:hypothetical protein
MKRYTWANDVLRSEISCIYLQGLFETFFSLKELLNMAAFRNFEVMLGQTLNYFVWNSVILYTFVNYLYCYF